MTGVVDSYSDLLTPEAIRTQSRLVTDIVRAGDGLFWINEELIEHCARLVADITLERYPSLEIPYHSRWRHFHVEGSQLLDAFDERSASLAPREIARTGLNLVIPSVLLDAGAGSDWAYQVDGAVEPVGRSEGLGLASLQMFMDGKFSSDGTALSDAEGLMAITDEDLAVGFQVTDQNKLLGISGRRAILNALGEVVASRPEVFQHGHLGDLADYLLDGDELSGRSILITLLDVLAPIWPDRLEREGLRLGDAWHYEPLGDGPGSIVPFHKLSQWLSYSLIETFERSGFPVTGVEALTGLPEYRNGGLLYETGVIGLYNPALALEVHDPASQLIVEWRALTISLLDQIAELVREILDRPDMLLVEILEGGTWALGRRLAFARDRLGRPPLKLNSDGTVF